MTYKQTHDHLGNPVSEEQAPWRGADLVVCAFLFGVVFAILRGALA
jgi:hypothetical protein